MDDELGIRLFLEETLTSDGHQVVTVESGEEALALIAEQSFDLALLDLNLTGIGGMEVLAALRQQAPDTVIIILTAHATLETAIEALQQGAHDYLFKPCKMVQLRQSIRQGLLNRQQELQQRNLLHQLEQNLTSGLETLRATIIDQPTVTPEHPQEPSFTAPIHPPELLSSTAQPIQEQECFLQRGGLIVDFSRYVITLDGCMLELSPTEFDLLVYLISQAPQVASPQQLVHEIQGYKSEQREASEIMRQHIRRLRRKIKKATGRTNVIRTVRGVGYIISE